MTVKDLQEAIGASLACGSAGLSKELSGCYIGDLLSLAMSKVQEKNVWITIQTNINIAAVATLTEAGCILLCEGFSPDENTAEKAEAEEIPILCSELSEYELAGKLTELGI